MSLFWKRKQNIIAEKVAERANEIKVDQIKHQTHETATQANKDIKKLNSLLRANGITLKIHIASGGHHGH